MFFIVDIIEFLKDIYNHLFELAINAYQVVILRWIDCSEQGFEI